MIPLLASMSEQRVEGQVALCTAATHGGDCRESIKDKLALLLPPDIYFKPHFDFLLPFLIAFPTAGRPAASPPRSPALSSYLQLSEDRMILDAWEKDPHGVRPVV